MDYILCFVIVCFAVFTAGQSADLSIDVSYTSIQGELVRYQLFHGDTRDVQVFILKQHKSNVIKVRPKIDEK